MNSTLARTIFEAGVRVRNPTLFEQYDYLKSTEWLSRKELEQIQLEGAERFLRFCGTHSSYYHRIFREASFNPSQLSSVSDISRLPELDKATLIRENSLIHTSGLNEKLRLAETSGTSGEALAFYRNEKWDSVNRAALMRSYDWYGIKPWDKNGYLWGYNISASQSRKVALLDAIQNRFRLFRYSESEVRGFCSRLRNSSYISGYSSMVYEVAKCVNELELGPIPLKMVKGTSEMILDAYHPETVKAFGKNITSEYGAAEAGLIAFECPNGGIHVNIENVILEQNDTGELLVTNLSSYSFPVIRYRLGDMVTLSDETCSCGRNHPLIKSILGRKGANVQGDRQTYPALTFYYVFKNLALEKNILLNYKAVQNSKGEVTLYVEDKTNEKYQKDIDLQLRRYFGGDIRFSTIYIDRFVNEMKKKQYFETSL
ncbi:phenylacetate--CoA ligase family protein [Marinobacter sp.]|uniref:phenylacetate--CoA ligase family protein n=1 Tax=Marinobacter sp. TaxID=50741 RepID=UPI0034A125E0